MNMHRYIIGILIMGVFLIFLSGTSCQFGKPLELNRLSEVDLNTSSVKFEVKENADNPNSQVLSLIKLGNYSIKWLARSDAAWLMVSPSLGLLTNSESRLILSVNSASLKAGCYTATVEIINQDHDTDKKVIQVSLTVKTRSSVPLPPTNGAAPDNS